VVNHSPKPTESTLLLDVASRLGVPFAILLLFMFQLAPRIDHQTEIAERTSAYLGVLVNRGPCSTP
jgi:hypothetical protein